MDKINAVLNILQLACFFGIGYFLGHYKVPTVPFVGIIILAAAIDILSGYQARRETEKELK